jgi:hypothetical protein
MRVSRQARLLVNELQLREVEVTLLRTAEAVVAADQARDALLEYIGGLEAMAPPATLLEKSEPYIGNPAPKGWEASHD